MEELLLCAPGRTPRSDRETAGTVYAIARRRGLGYLHSTPAWRARQAPIFVGRVGRSKILVFFQGSTELLSG